MLWIDKQWRRLLSFKSSQVCKKCGIKMATLSRLQLPKLAYQRISNLISSHRGMITWSHSCRRPILLNKGLISIAQLDKQCAVGEVRYFASVPNKGQDQEEEDLDKPIKFSTSKSAKWTAQESLSGDAFPDAPEWQPLVVGISVASLLIYFCILREENDIDEEMKKPLWERIPNLERQQLELLMEYNRANNISTADIEKRLKEVYEEDAKRKVQNRTK